MIIPSSSTNSILTIATIVPNPNAHTDTPTDLTRKPFFPFTFIFCYFS